MAAAENPFEVPPAPRQDFGLNAQEIEFMSLLAVGATRPFLARTYGMSETSLARALRKIYDKTNTANSISAVALLVACGVIDADYVKAELS